MMISKKDLECAVVKLNLEHSLKSIEEARDEFQSKINEFSLLQADHFESIRRQIDIRRETIIEKIMSKDDDDISDTNETALNEINQQSNEMIKRIELTEETFRRNFNDLAKLSEPFFSDENLEREKSLVSNALLDTSLDNKDILKSIQNQYETKLNDIKWKLDIFKVLNQDLIQSNKFLPPPKDDENNLGKLETNSTYLKCGQIDNIVISTFGSNKLKIFNVNTNAILKTLSYNDGHSNNGGQVTCLTMYDTYKLAIGCQKDNSIRIYSIINDKCLNIFTGHSNQILCLKVLPEASSIKDCRLLVSGSIDHSIKIWNLYSNATECLFTLTGHYESVTCLDYQVSKENLISGSEDMTLRVWELSDRMGTCKRVIEAHNDIVTCVRCFRRDNVEFIASGSHDFTIEIYDSGGDNLRTLIGHKHFVCEIELNTACDRLISASSDKTLLIWDLLTYECLFVKEFLATSIRLNPKTDKLVCSTYYGKAMRVVGIDYESDNSITILDSIKCMDICPSF